MGMMLPSELVYLLQELGYKWPEGDEEKLFDLAGVWTDMADRIQGPVAELDKAVRTIMDNNKGADIEAFTKKWQDGESPAQNIADIPEPNNLISIGLMIAAGVVLALKIQVIVQLVMLAIEIAQAIATSPVTFGASLAEIPIFKIATGLIINELIDMAIQAVLNG